MRALRATEVFTGDGIQVLAVEAVELRHGDWGAGGYLHGRLEPVAVVVCDRHGVQAIDMAAGAADIERLRREVLGLDALVDAFIRRGP